MCVCNYFKHAKTQQKERLPGSVCACMSSDHIRVTTSSMLKHSKRKDCWVKRLKSEAEILSALFPLCVSLCSRGLQRLLLWSEQSRTCDFRV